MLNLRRCFRLSSTINYEFAIAKPKKEKTFYQILEVPTSATPTIIKKNYLKLAKIYHPDVYKGADRNRFQKIQEAYKVLSNQGDRSKYDETIGLRSNY
jgi:curved DNA-binding protein CbpA